MNRLLLALGLLGVLPVLPKPRDPEGEKLAPRVDPPREPELFDIERAMAVADEERRVGEEILRSFYPGAPDQRAKRRSAAERKERRRKRCQRVRARRAAG